MSIVNEQYELRNKKNQNRENNMVKTWKFNLLDTIDWTQNCYNRYIISDVENREHEMN